MKTFFSIAAMFITGFLFISCEGPKNFSVIVVDKITKKPLDSVMVQVKVKAGKNDKSVYNLQGFTDTSGKFVASEMIGYGLSARSWNFYMEYSKKGYVQKTEINHTEGQVELEH